MLLQYYSVLQSTTPVLLCTAKYYSSTALYYKVLLQYYSVLQSTTPVLLCTPQYYNVLLQYYPVLQRTTPVLLCTTQYYKVLLQYYSVLQSTTPVLLCTTKYYNVLLCTTQYYNVLLTVLPCTTKYYSSTTLYCKVRLQYYSVYYKVLLQYYSVVHSTTTYYSSTTLYYKAAFMIDPWHIWTVIYMIDVRRIWNVIYNARSNRSHPPTSPNTAPATQNDCDDWSASDMKRHLQCAEQQESQSNFTKYCACHAKKESHDWSASHTHETSFTMSGATGTTIQLHQITAPATQNESHDWSASHMKRPFTMRGATNVTGQVHQILHLPRKMNLMIDPRHIWNVIYNERSNKNHNPTSPNTAPATQNESHDWSASHMKRHLQCAEQAKSPSNFTKYCACHAKWISWMIRLTCETSFTMREATRVTLQLHQILRLPRKMNVISDPRHIWNVISNARSK